MKRSKHTLSHYRMVTGNMGEFLPIGCVPVLPGDTFQHSTNAMIRVTPLNTPVMHPVAVRLHHFFVPNRIVFDDWEDFITGGTSGASTAVLPRITSTADKKELQTYLGVPPIAGVQVNAMPVRAANMIFNEYYRDQDLEPARVENDKTLPFIAWEKDYFTTARPFSQRGPDVTLPLGQQAPVRAANTAAGDKLGVYNDLLGGNDKLLTSGSDVILNTPTVQAPDALLYADLASASAPSVNDFRGAFALQRYQEARARYGARFTEYLRYLGISPSDARLQRPEFLGGGSTRINFSEVLQTTPNATANEPGVGDLYGHGIAGVRGNSYRKFFEEHGYVITILSVRPKSLYLNGLHREFKKETKEDYYQKELANLGQQEVRESELYSQNAATTFGFQDRYHEYRSHPSQVSQDFRDTLNAWHLGRELAAGVTLNQEFIQCKPSDRIFQVNTATADSLWIMANHHLVARRMVPKRANPRIM